MTRFKIALLALFSATNVFATTASPARDTAILRIEAMIQTIKNNKRTPGTSPRAAGTEKVFAFTEQEVNDYLAHWIANEGQKGKEVSIKSGSVRLQPGHILEADAVARLEAGSLKSLDEDPNSLLSRTLKGCLSVDSTVHAKIFATSAKGKIFLKAKEIRLNGGTFPDAWVQKILQIVGRKRRPPLDFNRLFDLPSGIWKIEILPQSIKIHVKLYAQERRSWMLEEKSPSARRLGQPEY